MTTTLAVLALAAAVPSPEPLLLDGPGMAKLRLEIQAGTSDLAPALAALRSEADKALTRGPWTVTAKSLLPPSGDKHDYMSVGPYWWPDPKKADGLPYIRRDGEVNPERNKYDNVGLSHTVNDSLSLSLAWYYTGNDTYAEHAAKLLRTWFLDSKTRMNPNLNYGQAIPGRTAGRGIGIIDTACLVNAVDAAILLEASSAWSKEDAEGLRAWFAEYLEWLLTSQLGKDENHTKNNHGTYYDLQVATFALYCRRPDTAKQTLQAAAERRIATQIEPNGSQPHELARTKSWGYSTMNLRGFMNLAILGERAGVDLWHYASPEGGGIRKALDWMIPFAKGESKWSHQQLGGLKGSALCELLRRAAVAYAEPGYERTMAGLLSPKKLREQRFQLTHPPRQ